MAITVCPVTSSFVAEVGDVDLSQPLAPADFTAIKDAFTKYAVLIFSDQHLSQDQHLDFARHFGPLETTIAVHRKDAQLRLRAELSNVSNLDHTDAVWGKESRQRVLQLGNRLWHTDSSFKRVPALASLLYARAIAPVGGHTEFSDLRAAYDALPEETKRRVGSLVAEHSIFNSRARLGFTNFSDEEREAMPPVPQVLVRRIAESGRKSLYLASHAGRILGVPEGEGRVLIDQLAAHATQRQFVYTHRWRAYDLVIWDNRCTMHRGTEFDDLRWRRDVQRATVSDVANTCEQAGIAVAAAYAVDCVALSGVVRGHSMKLPRRQFLHLAAGAAALPAVSRMAWAQSYPTRPVRIIVGYPAGGPNDIIGRLIGQCLSERLGQPFIIENRPGASANIATEAVVRSPPDGYTLLLVATAAAINATLYEKLNFNFIRDIAPVASIARVVLVMLVNPSFPAKTVPEFIAYAKANPGKINMASAGNGNISHVAGELFKATTGVNMLHVPYRGGAPAMTDLLGGQVQVYFGASESIEYIRAGKLRPLAVTTATRSEALPDIPTVGEFVPGYEASGWFGVGAPRNTPPQIIDRLNKEINAGISDPKLKAHLADLGCTVLAGSPADFGKLIADETEKWAKVVKFAGIKPD